MDAINTILQDVPIPKMACVKQLFDAPCLADVEAELLRQLSRPEITGAIHPGQKIAVTAGSRGIDNLPLILKTIVTFLKDQGALPFLIPAMGSHGGADANGQKKILHAYQITEKTIGAPICATMEVKKLCSLADGTPVYIDAFAHGADGIVVVNRIKYHTLFQSRYESGLMKMMAVGLGKQKGAQIIHSGGPAAIGSNIERTGHAILQHAAILFGVATIENALEKTRELHVLSPQEIPVQEPLLLQKAKQQMPRLYFENLDLLIVDRIGKNISGSGMDPNITHTFTRESKISGAGRAKRICVLALTAETHGCGLGVGMADVTTKRLFDAFRFEETYPNALTTSILESAKIPAVFETQKQAIQAAIHTLQKKPEDLRAVRIQDTLHLEKIFISQALAAEAAENPRIELLEDFQALQFDQSGNLF